MTVELIYDRDCPHVAGTRANLSRAFSDAHLPQDWKEWDRSTDGSPARVRAFGSPTVLINGRDVADAPHASAACCRLYVSGGGRTAGVPPVEVIRKALLAGTPTSHGIWKRSLAVVPGIGVAVLPKLACPMCLPAYAGLLTTMGLGFLISSRYLFVVTAVFLFTSIGALAFRAKRRRGYGPALAGIAAGFVILFGKFSLESNTLMYAGLGLLVAASIWNSWPRRPADSCPRCVPGGDGIIQLNAKEGS